MKRTIIGTVGVLATQMALWPHHHIIALAADAISIVVLTGARERKRS